MAESYRDKMRPASFRGVPFEVKSREGKTGRRGPDHEYPDRDEGYPEDTGRLIRRYTVEAFILASRMGGNYLPTKDKLLEALEKKGPGEYIDQWGDSWQVQARLVTWRESVEEGGKCTFQINFTEYNPQAGHTVTADTGYAVAQAADKAGGAVAKDFAGRFNARGNEQSATAQDNAAAALDQVNGVLTSANLSSLGVQHVAGMLAKVTAAKANMTSLLASPMNLANSIRSLMTGSLNSLSAGWPRYRAAQSLASYGADFPAITPTTAIRAQAATNQAAMIDLVRGLAATEAAKASADIPFVVYDDAVAVRDEVATALDARMMTASDPVYQAMSGLRAAAVRDITTRGADLSRLSDVQTQADTPALVLAHRLYGDASREADVLSRNPSIRHPGFIPGGMTLKVPTDV